MTDNQAKELASWGHWIADLGLLMCVLSYMRLVVPGAIFTLLGALMMMPYLILDFEGVDP